MGRRHELTEAEWARLATLLPWRQAAKPRKDDRLVINGILWKLATGARWASRAGHSLSTVGFAGIPITTGIAILKYQLYEIDTLINRTLVYGSLTALLAPIYFGVIVMLQSIFVTLT